MNELWDLMLTISNAAKQIFRDNLESIAIFAMPRPKPSEVTLASKQAATEAAATRKSAKKAAADKAATYKATTRAADKAAKIKAASERYK